MELIACDPCYKIANKVVEAFETIPELVLEQSDDHFGPVSFCRLCWSDRFAFMSPETPNKLTTTDEGEGTDFDQIPAKVNRRTTKKKPSSKRKPSKKKSSTKSLFKKTVGLLSVPQAAELRGVSHQTILNWVSKKKLKPVRGKTSAHNGRLFREEDVLAV